MPTVGACTERRAGQPAVRLAVFTPCPLPPPPPPPVAGTVFGYSPKSHERQAGEFGHNDFYPVVVAACQAHGHDGRVALS